MGTFDAMVLKNQALALLMNIWSWAMSWIPPLFLPSPPLTPPKGAPVAVQISGPGGLDQLRVVTLDGRCCVGYNVPGHPPPYTAVAAAVAGEKADSRVPRDAVVLRNKAFSVNYADVTIRWGLYESALRFVGWPIVPGFDVAGTVEVAGEDSGFMPGEEVYGCTMFGAYASRVLIPGRQLQRRPTAVLSTEAAAAVPAVAGTALHALALAGFWPPPGPLTRNRAVLVHSAAGGVGSMLVQMAKLLGCSPVVAVVGSKHKVQFCRDLGADAVIDKSDVGEGAGLWAAAAAAAVGADAEGSPPPSPFSEGRFAAVFDANGVSTLAGSYGALDRCGRLVVYGFHSNLPRAAHLLDPIKWLRMAWGLFRMPAFDPMQLTLESKAVLGFNLSFFADEHAVIAKYLTQINDWIEAGQLRVGKVTVYDSMEEVTQAHALIQSGNSVGKIVIRAT